MSSGGADSCLLVIFGASGDLTRHKLLPALYNLAESGYLPERFAILGVARPQIDEAEYRRQAREQVRGVEGEPLDPEKWSPIEERLYYLSGEFDDPQLYARIGHRLEELSRTHDTAPNVLFYFAIPPELFGTVARRLGD